MYSASKQISGLKVKWKAQFLTVFDIISDKKYFSCSIYWNVIGIYGEPVHTIDVPLIQSLKFSFEDKGRRVLGTSTGPERKVYLIGLFIMMVIFYETSVDPIVTDIGFTSSSASVKRKGAIDFTWMNLSSRETLKASHEEQ